MPNNATAADAQSPLTGVRVMVTRPTEPGDALSEQLRQLGAEVVAQPAIRISAPADWRPVDAALRHLREYDWIVFSSANGVRYFFGRMQQTAIHPLWHPLLAAMGPGTAEELAKFGRRADLVPTEFRAEALADALAPEAARHRFLLARASRGREVLAERLTAAGASVEQIVVYSSDDVETPEPAVESMLRAGEIDWITVTSSGIARSLAKLFGEDLRRAKLISISPLTSGVLRELGYEPAAEAAEYTSAGVTAVLVERVRLA
jgi:uroporphyrinogen III methyltransferase / synthase